MIQASRRTFLVSALAAMLPVARASGQSATGLIRFGVTVADNVVYAPVFAAAELGFFEAAGVKANFVPLRGAAAGEEALLAAQALDFRREGLGFPGGVRTQGAPVALAPGIARAHAAVRAVTPRWTDDAILHPVLAAAGRLVRGGQLATVDSEGAPLPW